MLNAKNLSIALFASILAMPIANAQEVDPAPSGTENSVIFEGENSSLGMPGADSPVTVTGTRIDFASGWDNGGGTSGGYDTNGSNTTIIYGGGGGVKGHHNNLQLQ